MTPHAPPLSVFITVDTEFSVGDAFIAPDKGAPIGAEHVYCPIDGRSEGLGFMLSELQEHEMAATFFIEALNTVWFGDDAMGRIARNLKDCGQDVQLHLHPFWLYFQDQDWRSKLSVEPPQDKLRGRSVESVSKLIQMGIDAFERWGVQRPSAFRSGNLDADENIYLALSECGIKVASNIGLAVNEPAMPALKLAGGAHLIHGVAELPVLSYQVTSLSYRIQRKSLTITGSSWPEIRTLLWKARKAGYLHVVLLTHTFEFVKFASTGEIMRPNRINQSRFTQLCEFIASHPEDFRSAVMREVEPTRLDFEPVTPLSVPFWQAASRMVVNRLNDSVMRL